ncbi:hypothetical protein LOTGIDRAFT_161063 [Lottia gigantea]|uniref:Major facilitator superfamily (MFS) profile domain-containing protein n=1 Tax=Lottia gigantea TaxID=225164 RepID=V4AMF1_LOTGI|nr:hypothetical protein LOTGIDRAFT_161063 [Lottia gigantea]ESO94811.1 hypothetical protein LOTGIDRAFT_161063 [Lottia gigantea]
MAFEGGLIRNLGFGCAATVTRVGSILATQVMSLAFKGGYFPYIIICILMTIDTCSILTLPETWGKVLKDTLIVMKKKGPKQDMYIVNSSERVDVNSQNMFE